MKRLRRSCSRRGSASSASWRRPKGYAAFSCRIALRAGTARTAAAWRVANARAAADQLAEYVRGEREEFSLSIDWTDVEPSHRHVLETLCEIAPFGRTVTYGELAQRSDVTDPREIGVLMSRNPVPLVVPCHRVVAADGLGGYGGGLELKRRLLELEGVLPPRLDLGDV